MVISDITYFPYQLTFKIPFVNSKNTISTRSGYIIEISDSSGNIGIGEAAPLPEFGSETLERTRINILRFISEYPEEINSIKDIPIVLKSYDSSAAKHGIEQALLNLFSNITGESLPRLFNESFNPVIKVNSLIDFVHPNLAVQLAAEMVNEGYETIKIKAGRPNFQHDIDVIAVIREAVGSDINLRIDVNGKWELADAIRNIRALEKFKPEYIEQPADAKEDLIKLASAVEVKIAADESLRSISDVNEFIDNKFCEVIILKPMMLGGISETLKMIRKAESNNIKTIISSSFESAIGFRTNILLASLIKKNYAHGLSTMDYFTTDIYANPFTVHQGKININDPFVFSRI